MHSHNAHAVHDPRYPIGDFCPPRPILPEDRADAVEDIAEMPERLQDALRGLRSPHLIPDAVRQLVLSWLIGKVGDIADEQKPRPTYAQAANVHAFIEARAKEIQRRVRSGRIGPMLSAPTHKFGWLEPREFVRRCKEAESYEEVPIADLIQALLRLAPDHRAAFSGQRGIARADTEPDRGVIERRRV